MSVDDLSFDDEEETLIVTETVPDGSTENGREVADIILRGIFFACRGFGSR